MFEEPEEYDRYHRFATEECLLQGIQSQNDFFVVTNCAIAVNRS